MNIAQRNYKVGPRRKYFSLPLDKKQFRKSVDFCDLISWFARPDRFALLPVTVEVPGEDDPAAGPAVGGDGVGDGDGGAEELIIVTQTEVSVEVINLTT